MKHDIHSYFLENFSILNLWDRDEIILDFKNRVTFLTGKNGSGKSSILNIIFDSLIRDPSTFNHPATSKNRFWASKAQFRNNLIFESFIIPSNGREISKEIQKDLIKKPLYDLKSIDYFYKKLNESSSGNLIKFIGHESDLNGEWWNKRVYEKGSNKKSIIYNEPTIKINFESKKPLSFIFQEDRASIHSSISLIPKKDSLYWSEYKNSIDERFSYCRNSFQIHESEINQSIADYFEESTQGPLQGDKKLDEITKTAREKNNILSLLNEYFKQADKEITRDEENKITLKSKTTGDQISWSLLSRGEKTLIYLFLMIYLYKNKCSLFLLDEPEISLHIEWQNKLIFDLTNTAPNCQFIIATHSPSLVENGWLSNCLSLKSH